MNIDMIAYRGISKYQEYKEGDILKNIGFIFCTLNIDYAKFYMKDTSECYKSDGTYMQYAKQSLNGSTLFKIHIPKGTHFLDNSDCNYLRQLITSEIILSSNISLKVLNVTTTDNNSIVETIIE